MSLSNEPKSRSTHHNPGSHGHAKSHRAELRSRRHRQQLILNWLPVAIVAIAAIVIAAIFIIPNLPKQADLESITIPPAQQLPQPVKNSLGDPNAPVKVEVFSDFNCSHCLDYEQTQEPSLISTYVVPGNVYYTFISYAFLRPDSLTAAEAAYCAMDQDKFWEYKAILFANIGGTNVEPYSNTYLNAYAKALDMDTRAFKQCLDQGKYTQRIQDDLTYGKGLGVTGTPYFSVNGKIVTRDLLSSTIDEALAAK
jgi:protein-disulfide isomerase